MKALRSRIDQCPSTALNSTFQSLSIVSKYSMPAVTEVVTPRCYMIIVTIMIPISLTIQLLWGQHNSGYNHRANVKDYCMLFDDCTTVWHPSLQLHRKYLPKHTLAASIAVAQVHRWLLMSFTPPIQPESRWRSNNSHCLCFLQGCPNLARMHDAPTSNSATAIPISISGRSSIRSSQCRVKALRDKVLERYFNQWHNQSSSNPELEVFFQMPLSTNVFFVLKDLDRYRPTPGKHVKMLEKRMCV